MSKNLKLIPKFESEDEEREFWAKADTSQYFDWSKAQQVVFPNLRPTTTSISLRLPDYLLARIKSLAHQRDVPYQSLMKVFLVDKVNQELNQSSRSRFTE